MASPSGGQALLFTEASERTRLHSRLSANDPSYAPALAQLRADIAVALLQAPVSVIDKEHLAPSGDRQDYQSLAPYWWPNPDRADGLPYVRRDGQLNPEARDPRFSDRGRIEALVDAVDTLSLGMLVFDDEACAVHAANLLRAFFVDPKTRMNPHLRYAQVNRGHDDGRFIGIIDTRRLVFLLDAVALLRGRPSWSADDDAAFRAWLTSYLDWLTTHAFGRQAAAHPNNHGSWYDVQVASYAAFLGREDLLRKALERARERIGSHFDAAGSQPHELARTRSFDYCTMNLHAFLLLARLGARTGVDLWGHRAANGATLAAGLTFLLPYADPARAWPHQQITPLKREQLLPLIRLGQGFGTDPDVCAAALSYFGQVASAHRIQFRWPLP